MRKVFQIGNTYPRENVVVMEFNRDDLIALEFAYGPRDMFAQEVREGMRLLDEEALLQQSFRCDYGRMHLQSDGCDCYM